MVHCYTYSNYDHVGRYNVNRCNDNRTNHHAADNDTHSRTNNIGWTDDNIDNYHSRYMKLNVMILECLHCSYT